jgi:hypothetical protein
MPSLDLCHILLINENWLLTVHVELQVVVLLKIAVPDIYSDDAHVVSLFNNFVPDTHNLLVFHLCLNA